jgi:hypothetical protein
LAFAYEEWARDNIVRAFVTAWAGVVLVWLILDWVGNPNRGRFRPQGPRRARGIRGRISAWRNNRDASDADIRETLRAVYGKSSLRLGWSTFDETSATAHDEARLTPVPQLLEMGAEPIAVPPTLETAAIDVLWGDNGHGPPSEPEEDVVDLTDAEPVIDLTNPAQAELFATTDPDPEPIIDLTETEDEAELVIDLTEVATGTGGPPVSESSVLVAEAAPPTVKKGWQLGDDPRSLTTAGATPTRTTVRSRAWKNRAATEDGVGDENKRRMARGRPPRRWNPISGKTETASIDVDDSFAVTWSTSGVDPFAAPNGGDGEASST